MTILQLDAQGRLLAFEALPPEVEAAAVAPGTATDWNLLFAAAGIDRAGFTETPPGRTPRMYADERRAWQGPLPGTTIPVQIEAAAYKGKPVRFQIVAPWTPATRDADASAQDEGRTQAIMVLLLLATSAALAHANLRSGRADRRGAFRLAGFTFFLMMAIWLWSPHVSSLTEERRRMFVGIGLALFIGGAMYLVYLALEPFVRRSWPTMLVGWSRALSGRIRDAVVGRDLLIGSACGAALTIVELGSRLLAPLTGKPEPIPYLPQINTLLGGRLLVLSWLGALNSGLQSGLISVLEFALIRELVQRICGRFGLSRSTADKVAAGLIIVVSTMLATDGTSWLAPVSGAIVISLTLFVILRVGLLAAVAMFVVQIITVRVPLTLDGSALYGANAWMTLGAIVVVAGIGFWLARAGEPLFGKARGA
jgi:hypothetical protein